MNEKIDLQKIADKLGFELEDIEMLVGVFISSAYDFLNDLKKAIDSHNYKIMYNAAHSIKGSAANLTLDLIANRAKKIEIDAKLLNDVDYLSAYKLLKSSIDRLNLMYTVEK